MFIEWSDIGTYHTEHGQENQDAITSYEKDGSSVVALCDGVTSCSHAKQGADIACASISNLFMKKGEKLVLFDIKEINSKTVSHILYDLKKNAEKTEASVRDFSSTVSCVLYNKDINKLLCTNIGDSLVGAVGKNGFEVIMKPQHNPAGCYVTTTEDVEYAAETVILEADQYSSIFICSDGLWKQFFIKGQMKEDIKSFLCREEYEQLIEKVKDCKSRDDRSIVVMKITGSLERDVA